MVIVLFGQHFAEYILTLAGGLPADQKVIVCLSDTNFKEEIPAEFQKPGSNVQLLLLPMPGPGKPLLFFKSILQFRRILREIRPDIIHYQEIPKGYSYISWLYARRSIRVLTVHDVVSHPGGDSKTSLRQEFIKKYMRKSADMLIVHGQKLLEQMRGVEPVFALKTRVIPHPAFRVSTVGTNPPVIENQLLFFGRIAKYKGLKYLVEACHILEGQGKIFSLLVAGKGDDFQINEAGLKQIRQVTLINRRIMPNEIDNLFAASDIVVLPYIEASQSGVIAYALGFGKPCIASRTGSIPEMIQDHFNGLLTVPADAKSLAESLAKLMEDKELKIKFSSNAALLASTTYSPETVGRTTFDSYMDMLQTLGRRSHQSI
jgi:glycosyltransferase involved in cell wall biosynthesis